MKPGRTSTLDSWITGSAPGMAAGDPSPTREGGVPAPFARFASNRWTTVPNQIVYPTLRVGLGSPAAIFQRLWIASRADELTYCTNPGDRRLAS